MKPAAVRVNQKKMVVASYTLLLAAAGSSGAAALASSTGKVNLTLTSNHMSTTTTWNQLGKTFAEKTRRQSALTTVPTGFLFSRTVGMILTCRTELGFL